MCYSKDLFAVCRCNANAKKKNSLSKHRCQFRVITLDYWCCCCCFASPAITIVAAAVCCVCKLFCKLLPTPYRTESHPIHCLLLTFHFRFTYTSSDPACKKRDHTNTDNWLTNYNETT